MRKHFRKLLFMKRFKKYTFVAGIMPVMAGATDPDNYQAYITVTIAKTANTPAKNNGRIEKMCKGEAELSAEGEEVITFQFSEKEAQ